MKIESVLSFTTAYPSWYIRQEFIVLRNENKRNRTRIVTRDECTIRADFSLINDISQNYNN